MVTSIGFSDAAGTLYVGLYVNWSASNSALYKSTDNGTTWTKLAATSGWMQTAPAVSAGCSDGTNLYLYFADNTLRRSSDGGATWTTIPKYLSSFDVGGAAVAGSPPDTAGSMSWDGTYLYLAGGVWVWRSNDNGDTWQAVLAWNRNGFSGIAASPSCTVVAGKGKSAYRTFDHGATWEVATGVDPAKDWRVGGYRSGHLLFGIGDGYLYGSSDNGTTVSQYTASGANIQMIITPATTKQILVGWYGYSSLFVGCAVPPVFTPANWSILPDQPNTVTATSSSPASHVSMTTDGSVPDVSGAPTSYPTTGSVIVSDPTTVVKAVAVVEPDNVIDLLPSAPVQAVFAFKTPTPVIAPPAGAQPAPLGVTVTDSASGDVAIVYTVDGSDPTFIGDSFDAGYGAGYGSPRNWTSIAKDFDGNYYVASAGDKATGGSVDGSIWKSADPTGSWTQLTGLGNAGAGAWSDIACGVNGTVFACIPSQTGSVLWRSQDFGATWEVRIPAITGFDSLKYLFADSAGNVAYSGPFGIIRSHDSGSTWSGGTSGANNAFGRVVADTAGNWYVTNTAGVQKSTDNGANWSLLSGSPAGATPAFAVSSDGTKMVWCSQPANPADFSSIKSIKMSNDSGVTWHDVVYDNNIAPAAFVFAPDGTIYGTGNHAASVGMLASYDNGAIWLSVPGPFASTPVLFSDDQSRIWGFDNEQYYYPFRYADVWHGNLYTGPLTFPAGSVTVKAIARKSSANYVNSDVASAAYVISQLRKLFAGLGGVWHEVTAVETGAAGTWKPASLHAGKDGNWH